MRRFSSVRPIIAIASLVALAAQVASGQVTVINDIEYFSPGSTGNTLDVYLPPGGADIATPTVLYIHGGGWVGGDKDNNQQFCSTMAQNGYAVVSANYTLATQDDPSFPQCAHDIKAVVRWIRTAGQGPDYSLSRRIAVAGMSAGGHLAALIGSSAGVDELEPLAPPPGGYRVQAVVPMSAVTDLIWQYENGNGDSGNIEALLGVPLTPQSRDLYRLASPITHVSPCDPAAAFYHGTADQIVPYQNALRMAAAFQPFGIYAQVNLAAGGAHGFEAFGGQAATADLVAAVIPTLLRNQTTADFDGSGFIDTDDFTEFTLAFEAGEPRADFDNSGFIDTDDYDAFVRTFEEGC